MDRQSSRLGKSRTFYALDCYTCLLSNVNPADHLIFLCLDPSNLFPDEAFLWFDRASVNDDDDVDFWENENTMPANEIRLRKISESYNVLYIYTGCLVIGVAGRGGCTSKREEGRGWTSAGVGKRFHAKGKLRSRLCFIDFFFFLYNIYIYMYFSP